MTGGDYSTLDVSPSEWRRLLAPVGIVWVGLLGVALWQGWPQLAPQLDAQLDAQLETQLEVWLVVAGGAVLAWVLAGWLALALALAIQGLWLRRWPLLGAGLIALRRSRWLKLDDAATAAQTTDPDRARRLAARRNAIALAEPRCPHWIADRWAAAEARVDSAYGIDAGVAWPRLWLLLPESTRSEVRRGVAQWHRACVWAAWAELFVLLGLVWWPLLLVALALGAWAYRLGRAAIDYRADLVEAVFDTHAPKLAEALGVKLAVAGRVDRRAGQEITDIIRKGS